MAYSLDCLQNLNLENLGLSEKIKADTKRYRMSAVSILAKDEEGNAKEGAKIEIKQTKSAFRFGCNAFIATQLPEKEQEKYDECFKKLFNQAVVPFYWHDDEPEEGVYRFKSGAPYIYRRPPADDVLLWCKKLDLEPKAHNMIWLNPAIGLPSWMPKDKTKLQKKLDDRIKMLSELYADKIPSWDVTNEVAEAGIYEDMPEDFEVRAHKLAHELFPDNHLIYNDYYGFYNDTYRGKRTNTYQIIKKILSSGGRIDGIGIQHHMFRKKEFWEKDNDMLSAKHILKMLELYSTFGKALHMSEITIPSYELSDEMLETQAKIVENLYRLWFSREKMESIVYWNMADGFAHVVPDSTWDENYYSGGLVYHNFEQKPAYEVLDKLINCEWHTEISGETGKNGALFAEMYHGDYTITVNGKSFNQKVDKNTDLIEIQL